MNTIEEQYAATRRRMELTAACVVATLAKGGLYGAVSEEAPQRGAWRLVDIGGENIALELRPRAVALGELHGDLTLTLDLGYKKSNMGPVERKEYDWSGLSRKVGGEVLKARRNRDKRDQERIERRANRALLDDVVRETDADIHGVGINEEGGHKGAHPFRLHLSTAEEVRHALEAVQRLRDTHLNGGHDLP